VTTKSHSIRTLYDFMQSYFDDAAWYRERADRLRAGREADHCRHVAAWLEGKARGYQFRAREIAYDACGGRR
jgi:hypothetical protein